jgi:flagellar motor switch protein FliM
MAYAANRLTQASIRQAAAAPATTLAKLPSGMKRFLKLLTREIHAIAGITLTASFESYCRSDALVQDDEEADATVAELLESPGTDGAIRVSLDRQMLFGLCDAVFGGAGLEQPFLEQRPYSAIEKAVASLFTRTLGRAFPAAFEGHDLTAFAPPPVPAEDAIDVPEPVPFVPLISIRVLCTMHGYSGEVTIELSSEITSLLRDDTDEKAEPVADPKPSQWQDRILSRVENMDTELVAVLSEFQMSLAHLTSLQVGQMIGLNTNLSTPLEVRSGGVRLCRARLGQNAQKYCLRVEQTEALHQLSA